MACEQSNAIIAAAAAIAGVVISLLGNWFLSWLKEGHERKVLLRSKYEELAFLVVESLLDYQKLIAAESNQGVLADSQPIAAQKAVALAQLYFPELTVETNTYLLSLVAFRNACVRASADSPTAHYTEAIANAPAVVVSQEELQSAKASLDSTLRACAKTYTLG